MTIATMVIFVYKTINLNFYNLNKTPRTTDINKNGLNHLHRSDNFIHNFQYINNIFGCDEKCMEIKSNPL